MIVMFRWRFCGKWGEKNGLKIGIYKAIQTIHGTFLINLSVCDGLAGVGVIDTGTEHTTEEHAE